MDQQRLYEYRFKDIDQADRDAVWERISRMLYQQLGSPDKILDPAAGRLEFINAVPAKERWGVDLASHNGVELRPGTRVITGDVMDTELPPRYFDAVFVSNFLEHLPDHEAIHSFLVKMRDCTRVGGRIAVMGPNIRYCADSYWDCADHEVALTDVAIEEHLYAAGFDPLETFPRFLPYSFRGRLPSGPRLVSAYLRLRPLWRLFGKQFLAVATR